MIQSSPPPANASQTPRSARQRIVSQGLQLFSTRGYNGVSMSEIAQAAGITKAALYYHFADKESLFLEVIRTKTAGLAVDLERIMAQHADLETLLREVALFLLDDGLGEYRQLQSDLLTVVDEERRKEHMRETRDLLNSIVPRIRNEQATGAVDPDIDLDAAVPLFFSMIGGQIRRFAVIDPDQDQPTSHRDLANLIVRIWLRGTQAQDHGESH